MTRHASGLYLRDRAFRRPPPDWPALVLLLVIVGSPLALALAYVLWAH